ncbi:MAG: DUF1989 domain-containing protein [bacterium]
MHIHRTPDQIAADRARYEEHQRRGLNFAPKAMPGPSPRPAPAPDPARSLGTDVVPFGWYTTLRLAAGEVLRLQVDGLGSSVSLACWSAADSSERMNLPDTIKLQWTTELRKGRLVFSDMGRVMLSICEDSSGAHDVLTGGTPSAGTQRNARDNMVLAAAKLGLDRRDLPALLTFFAPVRVDAEGRLFWRGVLLSGDDWVDLRAEMDLLVALSNTRHPLDVSGDTPALIATRLAARPVGADDLCRTATAEAVRGFENNARGGRHAGL